MIDYSKIVPQRVATLKPSGIRKFFDVAATMEDVISLGVGEPDFVTPEHIRQAGIQSLQQGKTQYTANYGLIELRRGIASYLEDRFDLSYNPDNEVLVTVGGSEAIDLCMSALLDDGDEVPAARALLCQLRPPGHRPAGRARHFGDTGGKFL